MFSKIKAFISKFRFLSGIFSGIVLTLLGLFVTDVYNIKIKPIILPVETVIVFQSVSTSSLEHSYIHNGQKYYYEITTFRIENTGDKTAQQDDKLKIQARGEILGITPKELNAKLEIDKASVAYIRKKRDDKAS